MGYLQYESGLDGSYRRRNDSCEDRTSDLRMLGKKGGVDLLYCQHQRRHHRQPPLSLRIGPREHFPSFSEDLTTLQGEALEARR